MIMKRIVSMLLCVLLAAALLGCGGHREEPEVLPEPAPVPVVTEAPTEPETTEPAATEPTEEMETEEPQPILTEPEETQPEETQPEETQAEETQPEATEPEHSAFYIPGVSADDVVTWFAEVCLDSEIINSGDPSFVQKWEMPIAFALHGDYTEEDWATLSRFAQWLNTLEGFPGISEATDPESANLHIYFTDQQGMLDIMGPDFTGMDGAVTFWYDGNNAIYHETICILTDLTQEVRNSVILEELYNGLGPVQDTNLRPDSLIWQGYSTPQELTEVDELILRLLYHPDMLCGLDGHGCEALIRWLYE